MKIVVFGPGRRTGALRDGMVVDLCGAFPKHALERLGDTHPMALAGTLVPWDLARFIEGGERTLENAQKALDYIMGEALERRDRRGGVLVHPAAETRLHAPRPNAARISCACVDLQLHRGAGGG